jgi:F-type H+-transporting ATPase subunit gamma
MQKVTKAMKLVAAAKLRRAQKDALAARYYTHNLRDMIIKVSKKARDWAPMLMRRRSVISNIDCLVITSDRGLCGSFNENLVRALVEKGVEHISSGIGVNLFVSGKKGWQFLKSRHITAQKIESEDTSIEGFANYVTDLFVKRFLSGESDGAFIAFNRFISASRQQVTFWDHVPLHWRGTGTDRYIDYIYEPEREKVTEELIREMLSRLVVQAVLESNAAELAARMIAMDKATKNADDMISHLTLEYNKARQSAITSELLDIVGGAEALQ